MDSASKTIAFAGVVCLAPMLAGCHQAFLPPECPRERLPRGEWPVEVRDIRSQPIAGATLILVKITANNPITHAPLLKERVERVGAEFEPFFDEFRDGGEVRTDTNGRLVLHRRTSSTIVGRDFSDVAMVASAPGLSERRVYPRYFLSEHRGWPSVIVLERSADLGGHVGRPR